MGGSILLLLSLPPKRQKNSSIIRLYWYFIILKIYAIFYFVPTYQEKAGDIIWGWQLGSRWDDQVTSVKTDINGDVFLAGYSQGGFLKLFYQDMDPAWVFASEEHEQAWLAKINGTDGKFLWGWQRAPAQKEDTAFVTAITIDLRGDIFVVGGTNGYFFQQNAANTRSGMGTNDVWIARLKGKDGSLVWSWQGGSDEEDQPVAIELSPKDGNLVVAGYTHGNFFLQGSQLFSDARFAMYADPFVFSLTSEKGIVVWGWQTSQVQTFNVFKLDKFHVYPSSIAFDRAGDLFITGYTGGLLFGNTTGGLEDAWLVKLTLQENPELIWGIQWGTDGYDYSNSVEINLEQNAIVSGGSIPAFGGEGTASGWVIKIGGANGTRLWKWEYEQKIRGADLWEYAMKTSTTLKSHLWTVGNTENIGLPVGDEPPIENNSSLNSSFQQYSWDNALDKGGWMWLTSLLSSNGTALWQWEMRAEFTKEQAMGLGYLKHNVYFDAVVIAGNSWGNFMSLSAGGSDCWCLKILVPKFEIEEPEEQNIVPLPNITNNATTPTWIEIHKNPTARFYWGWQVNILVGIGIVFSVCMCFFVYQSIKEDLVPKQTVVGVQDMDTGLLPPERRESRYSFSRLKNLTANPPLASQAEEEESRFSFSRLKSLTANPPHDSQEEGGSLYSFLRRRSLTANPPLAFQEGVPAKL